MNVFEPLIIQKIVEASGLKGRWINYSCDSFVFLQDDQVIKFPYDEEGLNALKKLCHLDLHTHNLALNHSSVQLSGVFDFGDCAFQDIHFDVHPLCFIHEDLARRVCEILQKSLSLELDFNRVLKLHLHCRAGDVFEDIQMQNSATDSLKRFFDFVSRLKEMGFPQNQFL